jgi:hypothetical protein
MEQVTLDDAMTIDPSNLPSVIPSTAESKKRPNSLSIITSSPTKVRPASSLREQDTMPHTPDQPTFPKNPDDTGDSLESIDEDNTKQMIKAFIDTITRSSRTGFRTNNVAIVCSNVSAVCFRVSPISVTFLPLGKNDWNFIWEKVVCQLSLTTVALSLNTLDMLVVWVLGA